MQLSLLIADSAPQLENRPWWGKNI